MQVDQLEKMCRTCLTEGDENMKSIFQMDDDLRDTRICEMLTSFTTLQITENDGLPSRLCSQCLEYLGRAFLFKQLCEQSESTLRQLLLDKPHNNDVELKPFVENVDGELRPRPPSQDSSSDGMDTDLNSGKSGADVVKSEEESEDDCALSDRKKATRKRRLKDTKDKASFTCQECGAVFKGSRALKVHDFKEHCGGKIICKICNKTYGNRANLHRHIRSMHDSIKRHLCPHCGKGFARADDLKTHIRRHTGEKPFKCEECDKAFTEKYKLVEHTRAHADEKNFVCSICGKGFSRMAGFWAHKKTHTGIKTHECNICGKKLSGSGSLRIHMKTHTGEKDYVCQLCGKGYTTLGNLLSHKRTHTGKREFSCKICYKSFYHASTLRVHLRSHSKEKNDNINSLAKTENS